MPHTEPLPNPQDASETNDKESRTPNFFPPVGNFNAVVPLSEIDTDSESRVTAPATTPLTYSPNVRAIAKGRYHDEQEEATLVPSRAARTAKPIRPAARRPSWPVMIAALALSLTAGLAAGVYLIKSSVPVEIQSPASMTEDVAHDTAAASDVAAEVSEEKTSRDLPAPKRVTTAEAPSGRVERVPETSPAKASAVERTPERPARKVPPSSTDTPAPPEALRARRATSAVERTPVQRAPERSLPVSSPPSSAKSKRVIQWP